MSGPFDILAGKSAYFAPQLMGNYNGNVIGTSNLAVQNIYSAPNPVIPCQVKQPFSATANSNPSLFFDIEQSKGIQIACNRKSHSVVQNNINTVPSSFGRQSSHPCKVCC
jgi:hypothetical protein